MLTSRRWNEDVGGGSGRGRCSYMLGGLCGWRRVALSLETLKLDPKCVTQAPDVLF